MTHHAVQMWLNDPRGGKVFTDQRARILTHSPICNSLDHVWTPRTGGIVCLSDLASCDGCNIIFFNEGLAMHEIADGIHYLCACCARRRGQEAA